MKRPHSTEHCSDYPKISRAIKTYRPCSLDKGSKQSEEHPKISPAIKTYRPCPEDNGSKQSDESTKRSRAKTYHSCF